MSEFQVSVARVQAFITCMLPAVYTENSVIAADTLALQERFDTSNYWKPRLACARRMLAQKIEQERVAALNAEREARIEREHRKRSRHAANLEQRRTVQALEAAGAGSGSGKKNR